MSRLLITGGTGFVGRSVLERLQLLDRSGMEVALLTRDPQGFISRFPRLAALEGLSLVPGDVRDLKPDFARFDGIIHAATTSDAALIDARPDMLIETVVTGTRNVLALAARCGPIPVLLASTGAIYGPQPSEIEHLPETYQGAPDPLVASNAYAEAKRLAELQCAIAAERDGTLVKIARMFAFVGPHLPLEKHFAIGNFIGDALEGRPITVRGDGTAVRSYLYADDMADWLWKIFTSGKPGRAYNLGSERAVTIAELAHIVAKLAPRPTEIRILGQSGPGVQANRYVPDTSRARSELGLTETTTLEDAISKMMAFHQSAAG